MPSTVPEMSFFELTEQEKRRKIKSGVKVYFMQIQYYRLFADGAKQLIEFFVNRNSINIFVPLKTHNDILGQAIYDFHRGKSQGPLTINNEYGDPEDMPIEVFFRELQDFFPQEKSAVKFAKGRILDVGAGAGAMSLYHQHQGSEVFSIEISELACKTMFELGVKRIIQGDFRDYSDEKFDTIFLMMNGMGIAGSVNNIKPTVDHLAGLLAPGGQIIFDSSDIEYLYEDHVLMPEGRYYGELRYQYVYGDSVGSWFSWLYADQITVANELAGTNYKFEVIYKDDQDQYVGRITINEKI